MAGESEAMKMFHFSLIVLLLLLVLLVLLVLLFFFGAPRSCPPPVGASGPCRAVPQAWKKGWLGPHGPLDMFLLVRALVSYLFFRHLASRRTAQDF